MSSITSRMGMVLAALALTGLMPAESAPAAEPAATNAPKKKLTAWDDQWTQRQAIVVEERYGLDRENEPVDVSLLFSREGVGNLAREIRVIAMPEAREAPCQIYNETQEDKFSTANVVFLCSLKKNESRKYLVYYGCSNAPAVTYQTDLKTEPLRPDCRGRLKPATNAPPAPTPPAYALTIENAFYTVSLAEDSGQIKYLRLKPGSGARLSFYEEPVSQIHWNPDVFAATTNNPRYWDYVHKWNPPPQYRVVQGPLTTIVTRWGHLPVHTGVFTKVSYQFYAGAPYILMNSTVDVEQDMKIIMLRNSEFGFVDGAFTDCAWKQKNGERGGASLAKPPTNEAPPFLEADGPWLAFYHPQTHDGFADIRLVYFNQSGIQTKTYSEGASVVRDAPKAMYWIRTPVGGWEMYKVVPAGCRYIEQDAYLAFRYTDGDQLQPVEQAAERLVKPLRVRSVPAE